MNNKEMILQEKKHIYGKTIKSNPNPTRLNLTNKALAKIKNYLRENNVTLSEFNTWLREEMKISQRDRIVIMDLCERDLDGFLNNNEGGNTENAEEE